MDNADFIATEVYNNKRQLMTQKLEDENGVIYYDKFEYDDKGNWILRIRYREVILQYLTKRELEYYYL